MIQANIISVLAEFKIEKIILFTQTTTLFTVNKQFHAQLISANCAAVLTDKTRHYHTHSFPIIPHDSHSLTNTQHSISNDFTTNSLSTLLCTLQVIHALHLECILSHLKILRITLF